MSTLVDHAKKELELAGEEPETIDWYLTVVHAFAAFGHSGGSASTMIPTIMKLLERKNLTPLTDDPNEWIKMPDSMRASPMRYQGLWQNCRFTEAFSHDGGKTYYLLSEGGSESHPYPRHKAFDRKKR